MKKISLKAAAMTALILLVTGIFGGCSYDIFYEDMADSEWTHYDTYSADHGEYLGRYGNTMERVYELEGLPKTEYLYAQSFSVHGGDGDYYRLLVKEGAAEPCQTLPIKKLTITTKSNGTVVIDDPATLAQLSAVLQNDNGTDAPNHVFDYNANIEFDVACNLTLGCIVAKYSDGTVHLLTYSATSFEERDYDVTDVLGDISAKLN